MKAIGVFNGNWKTRWRADDFSPIVAPSIDEQINTLREQIEVEKTWLDENPYAKKTIENFQCWIDNLLAEKQLLQEQEEFAESWVAGLDEQIELCDRIVADCSADVEAMRVGLNEIADRDKTATIAFLDHEDEEREYEEHRRDILSLIGGL